MNNRCHDPIRKRPHLPGFYQKLLAGNALDKIKSLDVILPEQLPDVQAMSPERSLLIAVLADAVHSISRRNREQIEEMEIWLSETDKDSTAAISFPRICQLLGLTESSAQRQFLAAIAHARQIGLVERPTHHKVQPEEPPRRPRLKMVCLDGKRMSYRRLTDAILQGAS